MSEQGTTVKDQIRRFIQEVARSRGVTTVADDQSLFRNDAMDSMTVYRLVAFLEDAFSLTIADDEMVPENFESTNQLERFVTAKLGKSKQKIRE